MLCAGHQGHECHSILKNFLYLHHCYLGILDPTIARGLLLTLAPWIMEGAAHNNLGTRQGCQRPEKHVAIMCLGEDEQSQVLNEVNEIHSDPTQG